MASENVAEEEDAGQLKLGSEFSRAKCLMNAEVALILDKKLESLRENNVDPMLQLNSVLEKSLQYVKRFSRYQNPQAVKQVREALAGKGKLHEFEVCVIGNLAPDTVDEAKSLVPSLAMDGREPMIDDDQIEAMLQDLKTIRTETSHAATHAAQEIAPNSMPALALPQKYSRAAGKGPPQSAAPPAALPPYPNCRAALLAALPPLAARAPPFAARAPPLAARAPPLQPAKLPLAAHSPPLQLARRPSAARSPPLQPAHRPLQPARRPLVARSPPLAARHACRPLVARSPPFAPVRRPAALLAPPCCAQPYSPALSCPGRPVAARPAVRRPAGRPSRAPPCPALRASLVLARRPACLYLLSDSRDSISLFDHTSGASLAPPATVDSATRSQWLTRDAAARLAVRNHLPLAERTHFGQHKTAKALYDAVVTRYSSPAATALGRLILPYLFPEQSAFATVEDLVTHLRTSDARYRAALPTEFLDRNSPPMYITLYFIVTRLPNSLRAVRDHLSALDPTDLTVDLLEQHLLAAETSVVTVGVSRGTPRTPFFEGCSPSPHAPSYTSAAAVDILGAEDVGAASALCGKRRSGKGKGSRSGGGGSGGGGGGGSGGGGGGGSGGSGGGSGGFGVGGGGGSGGGGGGSRSGGGGSGGGRGGAVQRGSSGGGQKQQQQRRSETTSPQQLREWFAQRGASGGSSLVDEAERPRWAELLRSGVYIFALDYDAILAAMYALSLSAEGDYYRCVPPDPGIEAAAQGATEPALLGNAPTEALHTFMLDSGASRCFFCDSTTLTPLSASVPDRLTDPLGGAVLARSSTVLPCPLVPSGSFSGLHLPSFSTNLVSRAALQDSMVTTTTPGGQRVSICTCTRTDRHLATFTRRPWSSLYTLATEPPQVAASAQVSASGLVAPPCSCRLLSHQTLLWHHRLDHPSLPCIRGMHSRLLVSGLPRSLPPLPPSPAPPCLPCVEGRQRAAPHSSSFPPTTAPLQTLHIDVWGPACVSGQGRECYFLLVVDDYTRYTMVFPLRSKGEDLPVLRLHSDRGGEFSSDLLRDFCRGEGILQTFTLPASPPQNGIAERRIGLVMEVACTSMIHAAAPHLLWLFAVRYAAHQINLWLRVSLPETSPTLCWMGKVGDASVFRVWGSRAFVRDLSAEKLSSRTISCVFLCFPPDTAGWQFYHPTSRCVLSSQDVTFDESVPFYRLFPYRTAPLPLLPLFVALGPPPVDPLPPQGLAPSGVSQVDPLPGNAPDEVAVDSGAARGNASGGATSGGAAPASAEPRGVEPEGAEPWGAESEGAESGGAEPGGAKPGGTEPEGAEPGGAESEGAEAGGAEPRGTASAGGPAGASPRLSPRREPLSQQQLRELFAQCTRLRCGAAGAGRPAARSTGARGAGATSLGGAGVTAGAGGTGGARAAGPGGARTRGTGAAGAGGVGGAGGGDPGAGDIGAGGARAGGARAGHPGAGGAGAEGTGTGGTGAGGTGA
ncbi:unnamed protein product [Closterium sp. NIES-53]